MTKPSPEYAITKLGMSHSLARKRDKPLRTYGRRSACADALAEPASKKPRLAEPEALGDGSRSLEHGHVGPEADKGERGAQPRASILNYFIAAPTARPAQQATEQASAAPVKIKTARTRKPRLLRLRAASSTLGDDFQNPVDKSKGPGEDVKESDKSSGGSEEMESLAVGDPKQDTKAGAGTKVTAGRARRRMQTTLNISSRAAFAECRVCNTVWNPLYPDDVRYHAKHHAAVMRARQKQKDEL